MPAGPLLPIVRPIAANTFFNRYHAVGCGWSPRAHRVFQLAASPRNADTHPGPQSFSPANRVSGATRAAPGFVPPCFAATHSELIASTVPRNTHNFLQTQLRFLRAQLRFLRAELHFLRTQLHFLRAQPRFLRAQLHFLRTRLHFLPTKPPNRRTSPANPAAIAASARTGHPIRRAVLRPIQGPSALCSAHGAQKRRGQQDLVPLTSEFSALSCFTRQRRRQRCLPDPRAHPCGRACRGFRGTGVSASRNWRGLRDGNERALGGAGPLPALG